MFWEALAYPIHSDRWLRTVGIGGVLRSIRGVILIPWIPLEGYFEQGLGGAVRSEWDPPVFEDWIEFTVDGVTMVAIQIASC